MDESMKLCLMGQGKELCDIARRARAAGHEIVGMVTYPRSQHDADTLEHQAEREAGLYESIFDFVEAEAIDLLETDDINGPDSLAWLSVRRIELLLSFRFRAILKSPAIDLFPRRIVNVHIGDLPHYRGSGAMSWMILNGETRSAIAYHFIDHGVDTGAVIHRVGFAIPEGATPIDIYRVASGLIADSCVDVISMFAQGQVTGEPQVRTGGSYFPRLHTLRDGRLTFTYTPEQFDRFCRAFGPPYAGAHCYLGETMLHLGNVRPLDEAGRFHPFLNGLIYSSGSDGSAGVVTGGGSVEILSLREGNRHVPPLERLRLGKRLT
jgi:methionyl-tRNA formyltransferase